MADENTELNAELDDQGNPKKKTRFSADDQEFINELVNGAYEKAFNKANKANADLVTKVTELTAEITELKKASKPAEPAKEPAQKADDKSKDKKSKFSDDPEYQAMLAQLDEVKGIANQLKTEKDKAEAESKETRKRVKDTRIKEEFITASKDLGFFDPMDVFALVKNDIDIDEETDEVVIINPKTKQPRLYGSAETNMTLPQFLSDFAKSKPHMVRADAADGGSGAGESQRVDKKTKKEVVDYAKMPREAFQQLTENVMGRQYTERS